MRGVIPTERPGSHVTAWDTVTGRFARPARIVSAIAPTDGASRKTPPVAALIAVAWPALSRPSKRNPDVPGTLTATTRTSAAWSAETAAARLMPALGSCDDESPNRTTILVDPARNPTAGSVASWYRALT